MRVLTSVAFVTAVAACGAGRPKPCDWYFAADRANVRLGPVRWLAGVWKGSTAGDQIWTRLSNGSMTGMWRRAEGPPGSDHFYRVREDGTKLTLVEITATGSAATYEAVEQGEHFVVFASPERGQLRFKGDKSELELTIESQDGAVEHHRFRLEI
jgi:hypothetical protein